MYWLIQTLKRGVNWIFWYWMFLIVIHLPRNLKTETKSCRKPEIRREYGVTFLVFSCAVFYPEAASLPLLAFKMHFPLLFWKFQEWELGVVLIYAEMIFCHPLHFIVPLILFWSLQWQTCLLKFQTLSYLI